MCESIGIEPAAAVVEPVVGGDAPEAPSHTRGVCVCLCRRRHRRSSSSSSAAAAVSLAALAAPLVRMKSSAVQVPAAVSCSSAVPTEHHRQHTRCAPPDAPAARRTAGWGCGRNPKRAAHLVDCKAASWGAGAPRLAESAFSAKCVRHFSSLRDVNFVGQNRSHHWRVRPKCFMNRT